MFDKPMEQRCAMDGCTKHLERRGGGFVWSREKNALFCTDCFRAMNGNNTVFNSGKNLWEFTTTHFNGERVHVRNLTHLRELEKRFGCSNWAANNMESRWNETPSQKSGYQVVPTEHMPHGSYRPEEHR